VVIIIDAINQMNGSDIAQKLSWLPDGDTKSLPEGLAIIVSTTPGPELDLLESLSGTHITLEELNESDKINIATSLLGRYGKKFSSEQMKKFLENDGARSPLWQNIAMSRLRQKALFETLTTMIDDLPATLDELVELELDGAEALAGKLPVQAFLLACCIARQGLRESEVVLILQELLCDLGAPGDALALSRNPLVWPRLRSALDIFLLHTIGGAPVILAPSHTITRTAILARYGNDPGVMKLVRTRMARFFNADNISVEASRAASEGSWALIQLGDAEGLANLLSGGRIMHHMWYCSGDVGHWQLHGLWRQYDELCDSRKGEGLEAEGAEVGNEGFEGKKEAAEAVDSEDQEETSMAIRRLVSRAFQELDYLRPPTAPAEEVSELAQTVVVRDISDVYSSFKLVRSIFELIIMFRRQNTAKGFLEDLSQRILRWKDIKYPDEKANTMIEYLRVLSTWANSALAESLFDCGKYTEALLLCDLAIISFMSSEDPPIPALLGSVNLHSLKSRIFDLEKRFPEALEELDSSMSVISSVSLRGSDADDGDAKSNLWVSLLGGSSLSDVDLQILQSDTWKEMANVYFSLENWDIAESYFSKALAVCHRIYGPEHPHSARMLWGIAICQKGRKDFETSLETHRQVLEVFEKCLGPNHPDTADMIYNIGFVSGDMHRYGDAVEYLVKALHIYMKVYGTRHRHIGYTLNDIGEQYWLNGNLDAALENFEMSLDIRMNELGADSEETQETASNLKRLKEEMMACKKQQQP